MLQRTAKAIPQISESNHSSKLFRTGGLRMGKRGEWADPALEWSTGTGELDLDATIENREILREERGETPTQYEAPKDRKWKARNVITIHWQHLGIECPYPSMVHIFACVVDHSNINNGRCDASQRLIALETGFHRNTVRRVLQWVEDNTPFLTIERRTRRPGGKFKSHAYHVQWQALELHWIAIIENIEATKEAWRDESVTEPPCHIKGVHGHVTSRGDTVRAPSRVCSNHESLNHEDGNTSLRVPSNEATHAEGQIRENEEGKQEQRVESASTNSQPLEGPSYGEAQERVSRYCVAFHWDHLTEQEFDAAVAAEMEVVGSGRAVIDAAANRTWQAKRKGNGQ
jgi:hypothetical protein